MRIVHIEDFFHPDAGYQVNVMSKHLSKQGHEVIVVTAEMKKMPSYLTTFFDVKNVAAKDQEFFFSTGVKIVRVPLHAFVSGRAIYQSSIFSTINSISPDILYVHGSDTYIGILYILIARWLNYPVVFDNHMLEMASTNRLSEAFRFFYRRVVAPVITSRNLMVIRTVDDQYIEKCLGVPVERSTLIPFGTDTDLFSPNREARRLFREEHSVKEEDCLVVYAGKLDESKGGLFLAESIRSELSTPTGRSIIFMLVGNPAGETKERFESAISASHNRVLRFPTQRYSDLPKFYQAADLAIFPKQCSLSFFDVQSCGLPVLFERNSINTERSRFHSAITFEPNDMQDLRKKLTQVCSLHFDELSRLKENSRRFILTNYNYDSILRKYIEVFDAEYSKFHSRRR